MDELAFATGCFVLGAGEGKKNMLARSRLRIGNPFPRLLPGLGVVADPPSVKLSRQRSAPQGEEGAMLIMAAILMPVLIIVSVVLYDAARIYIHIVKAEEIALLSIKIATSTSPISKVPTDGEMADIFLGSQDEHAGVKAKRSAYHSKRLTELGRPWYSDKEKMNLNLMYGMAQTISPDMYFPIPEPLGSVQSAETELGGHVNCSITFEYAERTALPKPFPNAGDPSYLSEIHEDRDRIYRVDCAIPVLTASLVPGLFSEKFLRVSREGYSTSSGDLCHSVNAIC